MATTPKAGAAVDLVDLVDRLFNRAFNTMRGLRSDEYKAGTRAVLEHRVRGGGLNCPYRPGAVQADAFYAGVDEGHRIWRAHLDAGDC